MNEVQYHRLTAGIVDSPAEPETISRPGWLFPLVRKWGPRLVSTLPVLALFALFITTGLRGVNFGYHWDEPDWHIAPARLMVQTGVFLPKTYIYPSFDKWLVLLPALVDGVRAAIDTQGDPKAVQAAMLALFDAGGYLLRARSVFIVVSSLAILWVYGAALALRYRPWEAFVAACGIGLSWEFAYHARFAVADCILVQFTALTLFTLALFHRTGKPFWLYASSVVSGLAVGTKYPGVVLLVWVMVASVLTLPRNAYLAQLRRLVSLGVIASAVYLLTTPATLLEPFKFVEDTRMISSYYANNHHAGHTVSSGWDHGRVVFNYLAFSMFSGHQWLAVPMFAMTVLGGVRWVKRDRRVAAFLVGFPCLFLLMFCAKYRLMLARNYVFLLPCLALLMGRAVGDVYGWLGRPWLRRVFAAAMLGVLGIQVAWEIGASESIRHIDPNQQVREALEYVKKHADTKFRVSNQVLASAHAQNLALPMNVVRAPAGTEVVFFGNAEGPGSWFFQTNDPWLTKAVFGPREMNFNWYAGWLGHDHVVVMNLEKARATGVPVAR
ncbi:MAG TPA: phospholipid carrier-dependent glycosyltransferase [Polyangiaceae bacterium]|nr:phospholipid carrier-dependent glycosyltransferase [Polyangiaceae bacterium]